jgi:hypothetical protein
MKGLHYMALKGHVDDEMTSIGRRLRYHFELDRNMHL